MPSHWPCCRANSHLSRQNGRGAATQYVTHLWGLTSKTTEAAVATFKVGGWGGRAQARFAVAAEGAYQVRR